MAPGVARPGLRAPRPVRPADGHAAATHGNLGRWPPPSPEPTLDHVAVAVERWSDAWPRYAVELGGELELGGPQRRLRARPAPVRQRGTRRDPPAVAARGQPVPPPLPRPPRARPPSPHLQGARPRRRPSTAPATRASRRWAWTSPIPIGKRPSSTRARRRASSCSWPRRRYAWESPPPEGFPTGASGPAGVAAPCHPRRRRPRGRLGAVRGSPGADGASDAVAGPGPNLAVRRPGLAGSAHGSPPDRAGPGPVDVDAGHAFAALAAWLGGLSGRAAPPRLRATSCPDRRRASADDRPHRTVTVAGLLPTEGPARVVEPGDNLGTRLVLVASRRRSRWVNRFGAPGPREPGP